MFKSQQKTCFQTPTILFGDGFVMDNQASFPLKTLSRLLFWFAMYCINWPFVSMPYFSFTYKKYRFIESFSMIFCVFLHGSTS